MRAIVGLSLAALFLACDSGTTTEVTISELQLSYAGSETGDPGADPACPHHYAPAQMTVNTSWGATTRLEPRFGSSHSGSVAAPEAPGEYWIYLIDIGLCGATHPQPPRPTAGLSVNGVELHRQRIVDGGAALLFSLSRSGVVTP
ncbi:MAG: hypothetical protein L0027_02490 [Candidatus Rokubacteria bacterium]|nr:hypothetical protein [Candidatus Rokubacteria bacterium]